MGEWAFRFEEDDMCFRFDECQVIWQGVQRPKVLLNNKEAAVSKWKKNTEVQLMVNNYDKLCK